MIATNSIADAKAAGLAYQFDQEPGIRREKGRGGLFRYVAPDGSELRDEKMLDRIRRLGIPPAWTDVWIAPKKQAHIQATGRDARGRKQYRYHPEWRRVRDEAKYGRMYEFGTALPGIRAQVECDLALKGLPRAKVLALVVRLLELSLIRVGNDEYAKENGSFGLTTMRDRHVDIAGATITFDFKGKSGKRHRVKLADRRLARIVRRCRDVPGFELFQYLDEDGARHAIESSDVNDYLREITGQDFTAKDFRTWAGTVLAAMSLRGLGGWTSQSEAKHRVTQAVKQVAEKLGNTPTICRKCYIHPAVVEAYLDRALEPGTPAKRPAKTKDRPPGLAAEEWALLTLLRERQALVPRAA
jgi:DNA topoisomerase-1